MTHGKEPTMRGSSAGLSGMGESWQRQFKEGFVAMFALWSAALPTGLAYGVAAHDAGLSAVAAQLFSLLLFSTAGQIGALTLLGAGVSPLVATGAVLTLNTQLLLLGLTIGRHLRPPWPQRLLLAFFLTDGTFAVAVSRGPLRLPTLFGAGVSMYIAWNTGTVAGSFAGDAIPDVRRFGIDFTLPLVFLALLIPLVRTRAALLVVLTAGATTLLLGRICFWRDRHSRGGPPGGPGRGGGIA